MRSAPHSCRCASGSTTDGQAGTRARNLGGGLQAAAGSVTASPRSAPRRHDIDALRVLAFGSLMLYHLAMFYVAEWDWHIKSVHVADWLQWPMLAVNRWRTELLFLISGLALSLLLRRDGRSGWRLARQRSGRLLLPLAFGMAVVVPIQPYAEALGKGAIQPGFGDFLLRYWSGAGFPPDSFGGWEHGWTWNHLWYLAYLWVYTLLLLALLEDEPPLWQLQCVRLLRWSYQWLALCAVLGWAHQHLNRPRRWLPCATEAVYPWYVLHQSLIVALGFGLAPLALGPVAEPALILLGTLGGCALLHPGLIRRSPWLRPLFGLPARACATSPAMSAVAARPAINS